MTRQRALILGIMREKCPEHLTADEIFSHARQAMPHIARGTVYRNLKLMELDGEIGHLEMPDGPDRYDANPTPHGHLLCDSCGDLADLPEIVHGDTFRQSGQPDQHVSRKIYTVDRLAQLSLLEKLPNSYMWASAMPERCLRRWGFVQKICSDNQIVYHDAIAFNAQYNMSEIETELLEYIFSRYHR